MLMRGTSCLIWAAAMVAGCVLRRLAAASVSALTSTFLDFKLRIRHLRCCVLQFSCSNTNTFKEKRIEYLCMNFFHMSLCLYSIIILYLSRTGNERMKSKLEKECNPHAVIVAIGVSA